MSIEVEVGGVYEEAADLTPAGVVSAFAGINAPSGWLLCDGSSVSRVTYSRLFDAIGNNFGNGDGSGDTFNLPDLQGYFIRGRDNGTGNDPDVASRTASALGGNTGDNVGSKQDSAMWGHKHSFKAWKYATNSLNNEVVSGAGNEMKIFDHQVLDPLSDGTHGTPTLSSESRPKNVAMNYIIKI